MSAIYQQKLWTAWRSTSPPLMTDIPPSQAQMIGRASENSFDGGRTAGWVTALGKRAVWRSVRDERTGHAIHCVSDRPFADLTADLRLGLRLLGWMSRRPVVWYWWDQPWTRELPANVDPGPEHVNGGWAIPGVPEVHVYRREEAHKVLIHEAIHALGMDVPMEAASAVRVQFEKELGRQLWPHLGEAWTELFAEWLWCAASRDLKTVRARWAAQLKCSEQQAAMVWARIMDSHEAEQTNVFAYYVLKWTLMGHLSEVVLNPDRSLSSWFAWWQAARPVLTEMARSVMYTEGVPMRMGMTCNI